METVYTPTGIRRPTLHFPFLLSFGLLIGIVALCIWVSVERSGGFSYPVDDAYIHLSVARNWAEHGVFGVTPYEATSTSSSLLWTVLLALLIRMGVPFQAYLPLILNALAAGAFLWIGYRQLQAVAIPDTIPFRIILGKRQLTVPTDRFSTLFITFWLMLMVVGTSFQMLVQFGMEHTLHGLLALLFILQAGYVITRAPAQLAVRDYALLGVLTILLTFVRYEGLFTVGWAMIALLWQRRWRLAFGLLGLAVLPPLVYAIYSIQQGWYPIPNSLIVKANLESSTLPSMLRVLAGGTAVNQALTLAGVMLLPLFTILIGAMAAKAWLNTYPQSANTVQTVNIGLGLMAGTLFLQLMFVRFFDRYYIYLYAIGLLFLGQVLLLLLARVPRHVTLSLAGLWRGAPVLFLGGLLLYPFFGLGYHQLTREWYGGSNIYEQHHQMARFIRTYYTGEAVMANDIGVITYYADFRLVDIAGLATIEMTRAKRDGYFNSQFTEQLATEKGVKIAMIYEGWYVPGTDKGPPASWIRVGSWAIPDNKLAGSSRITFFATSPAEAELLAAHLREFAPTLPARVMVELPLE